MSCGRQAACLRAPRACRATGRPPWSPAPASARAPGLLGEPVADDGFGGAAGFGARRHGVHLGRVEKIDAALQRAVQDGVGRGLIDLLAKGHGAQADRRDVQVAGAELNFIHGISVEKQKMSVRLGLRSAQWKKPSLRASKCPARSRFAHLSYNLVRMKRLAFTHRRSNAHFDFKSTYLEESSMRKAIHHHHHLLPHWPLPACPAAPT